MTTPEKSCCSPTGDCKTGPDGTKGPCGGGGSRPCGFKRNVGTIDRAARAIFGLILIALVFVGPQTAWGWLGLLPLFSAAVGWCGMYSVCGINTGKKCCTPDGSCGCNKTRPAA